MEVTRNVLKWTVVMAAQFCEYAKRHWTVNFKWENCTMCELYLSEAIKNYEVL